jgi:uncharacterized Fe-S radical SAM superfamily protein PflX
VLGLTLEGGADTSDPRSGIRVQQRSAASRMLAVGDEHVVPIRNIASIFFTSCNVASIFFTFRNVASIFCFGLAASAAMLWKQANELHL